MKTLLFLLLIPAFAYTQAIELTYPQMQFDSHDCCWRKLSAEGRHHEAGALIVNYVDNSPNVENKHSLYWHAGQMFAMAGDTKPAVENFKKTYSIFYKWFGGEDGKSWYYFAKGTIAFVERDKKGLAGIIARWKQQLPLDNNYKELVRLLENWEKDYGEAVKI